MKRSFAVAIVLVVAAGLSAWLFIPWPEAREDRGGSDRNGPRQAGNTRLEAGEFIPVDTSRLMALPHPYELEHAFPNLNFGNERPLQLLHAGDGSDRLFVLCQNGKVYVFDNLRQVKETTVFLDLGEKVSRVGNEEGLLGIAFHPAYRQNGQFFVFYSAQGPQSVLSRYRVSEGDPNRADPDSEERLLTIPQPFRTQNGGSIEFGPDGYLYVGLGDGGSANDPQEHGQNLETLPGSILRIDVDRKDAGRNYAIPADNPFAAAEGKIRGEIWAYGLRNVWRLAFDRVRGRLWAGDVGQHRFEEINVIEKGGNYGWSKREAEYPFHAKTPWEFPRRGAEAETEPAKYIDPVASYFHSEGRAVVGGRVYRGSRLPGLVGSYVYADFVTGNVWALTYEPDEPVRNLKICNAKLQVAGFGEDRDGDLYLCAFDGNIYRFRENEDYLRGGNMKFPYLLSQTGLFESTEDSTPAPGLIPYSVNVPLWSDHAAKQRFIALPEAGKVQFSERGFWEFPRGTVIIKTFFMDMVRGDPASRRRLETRLLVFGPKGWDGYTYIWNEEQTDANLMDVAVRLPLEIATPDGRITQEWYFPSRSDCRACHTKAAHFVLSINTRQLNRTHPYKSGAANQLEAWAARGVFSKPLPAPPEELESFPDWNLPDGRVENLARAYLEVNCAFCHAPGGPGNSPIDLRFHTSLERMNVVGVPPRGTRYGGPPASAIVLAGRPQGSELFRRMQLRGVGQMPILATSVADERAIGIVARWIEQIPPRGN